MIGRTHEWWSRGYNESMITYGMHARGSRRRARASDVIMWYFEMNMMWDLTLLNPTYDPISFVSTNLLNMLWILEAYVNKCVIAELAAAAALHQYCFYLLWISEVELELGLGLGVGCQWIRRVLSWFDLIWFDFYVLATRVCMVVFLLLWFPFELVIDDNVRGFTSHKVHGLAKMTLILD